MNNPGITSTIAEPIDFGVYQDTSIFSVLRRKNGWTDDYLQKINDPFHAELKDVEQMTAELERIRLSGEQLVVLPDFDMDGVTSGVLGWAGLNELGFNVHLYVPDYRRGHDISVDAVRELRDQFPHASAIITCDGGINSNEGIEEARRLGLRTLVTDHHVELPPGSAADFAVNPERIVEDYAHPGICGAYVLHQVLVAYAQRYAPHHLGSISLLKLFAGIGTVSDVMPLFFENRQMVRDSLSLARMLHVSIAEDDQNTKYDIENSILMMLLRSKPHHPAFVSAFEGFALMMQAFKEHRKPLLDENGLQLVDPYGKPMFAAGKLRSLADLNEEFYAFYLAPAFNAIRRVEGSMHDAFGVFMAPTTAEKYEHAKNVIDANELRKELSGEYLEKIWTEDQPLADQGVYFTDAPSGMLGLIASHIMRETARPTLVVHRPSNASDPISGSARSPFWFPIITTMTPLGFFAIGHESACGVRLENLAQLGRFAEALEEEAGGIYARMLLSGELEAAESAALVLGPQVDCDAGLTDVDELMDLAKGIDSLAPYGHGFPRPDVEIVVDLARCSIKLLGSDDQHLRIVLPIGMKVLWWNAADRLEELQQLAKSHVPGESIIRLHVRFSINVFRGNESVQAVVERMIDDMRTVDDE
ncbi:single-stranded-DNA-specific exonuclease [Plantibacter flavus]|uniref:Single-stranded-DNA-specific exonuclease n=1 Tax=Plantibacter flavus TaxID=150123 RepID=A0A3N2BLB3_9MICO|nr:DHH family phosphoesterase [Plantibacter flavus]ROR76046.1 single-stranded-DNA-specific exonuclease [Plantibacter flavus]SMG49009.1 single-stranded-DNA-specific exonuclease [Plantibacter flavus]